MARKKSRLTAAGVPKNPAKRSGSSTMKKKRSSKKFMDHAPAARALARRGVNPYGRL